MKLNILFHDNCFDGASSAAVFARFYRESQDPSAEILYTGVQHKPRDAFGPDAFRGDVNACVDFRYSTSPRLDWWFDHHVSAFQPSEDREHFLRDTTGHKFYDPQARSNTKFMAGVLRDRFGWSSPHFEELITWADIIDGAQFPDPQTAVELAQPALQVMTWLEHEQDAARKIRLIGDLQERSIGEIAAAPYVADTLVPIFERHRQVIEIIRTRAVYHHGVTFFDLLDTGIDTHNKFIPYLFYPQTTYTIGLTRSTSRVKISIGSNPWYPERRRHNIAAICERYGGGGHPVVGAISLLPGQEERARAIAQEIIRELEG